MRVLLGKNKMTGELAARFCNAELFGAKDVSFNFVCTDSREAGNETLFCAIPGERVDGHDYIKNAYDLGCRAFLCERIPSLYEDMADAAFVKVKDTVASLSCLALSYTEGNKAFVTAITGSVGKTTTKEFVASVFDSEYTYKTKGNYNSVIGLPLSLLEIGEDVKYAVLEMGMSMRGEIERMSCAASPDVAIITNVGSSHLEMLGSREGIRDAKLEIVKGLKDTGILLINGDDELLKYADVKCTLMRVSLKDSDCEFFAKNIRQKNGETVFDVVHGKEEFCDIKIPTLGLHNVYAATFAFALAILCKIPTELARERLEAFEKPKMRQNIYDVGGITLIEDCYNASPESMRSALDVLVTLSKEKEGSRKLALLGDMLELGDESELLHREVGAYAKDKLDGLVTLGELAKNIAIGAENENTFSVCDRNDSVSAAKALLEMLRTGDILLVKASRGVHAEKVIEYIKERLK